MKGMKRTKAIVRSVYHAFLPPFIERWKTGRVHYHKNGVSYLGHMRLNLLDVYDLLFKFSQLSDEDRAYHKL
jgi:hypothetical protein